MPDEEGIYVEITPAYSGNRLNLIPPMQTLRVHRVMTL